MSHSNVTLYSIKDLQELFSLSRSTIYRIINREEFPRPVVLGPADKKNGSIRWRSDEVQQYITTLPREKSLDV